MTSSKVKMTEGGTAGGTSRTRLPETNVSEDDWINAGAEALACNGVQGVRIPVLCKSLGVTKGSFYWHFRSLDGLLARVLGYWRQRATLDIIDDLTRTSFDPLKALTALLAYPRRSRSARTTALEPAIREWARHDDEAARAVHEVDHQRLLFFERIFGENGETDDACRVRAYIAYCLMMGDSVLRSTMPSAPSDEIYIREAIAMLSLNDMTN